MFDKVIMNLTVIVQIKFLLSIIVC